ncbi:MAG: 5-(carboxyamino)imidazole ribonucleotide synthase [Verrucomicrobia bacterium]|nr:5-(carboxyamino)imidazole ribonucleotide synthase [Verrucomicrobiota bacterium]
MKTVFPPGATIGLLGGGQLGRMFAIAARRMGYRVHTLEPSPDSPAGQISDREFIGAFDDLELIARFGDSVDVVTFEFENIPAGVVDFLSHRRVVRPRSEVLHICQNREREKSFLLRNGYPVAQYSVISSQSELVEKLERIAKPSVLKTADFGYDGKGQRKIYPGDRIDAFESNRAVLEEWIDLDREVSVICARAVSGEMRCFPMAENVHTNHILDYSIVPARCPAAVQEEARAISMEIAEELDVVGLIAVEFFLTKDHRLLVNELAPRPHNSGHYTFDACITSQFEQQLRAICGLPLGSPELLRPTVMVNLLGDLWHAGPNWEKILSHPNTKLHLYGKVEARPGRKMGHYCVLASSQQDALALALQLKSEIADDPTSSSI